MGDQQDGRSAIAQLAESSVALLLEARVTDCKDFVDQQDVGVFARGTGECEPEEHARRIGVDRAVEELADVRKLFDGTLARRYVAVIAGDDLMKEARVLAAGEVGKKSPAEV